MNRKTKGIKKKKSSAIVKVFVLFFFLLYMFVLTDLLLFSFRTPATQNPQISSSDYIQNRTNLTLLKTIKLYLRSANSISVVNILGNIVAFIPMGLFAGIPFKKKRDIFLCAITIALISLLFETIQLLFMVGSFDVDDILLNTIGGVIGFLIIRTIRRGRSHGRSHGRSSAE